MIREQTQFMETLMPREIDPKVGTLKDPSEGNAPLIVRVPGDIMKG